ncbi:MAG: hypothetical protein ACK5MT_17780 [Actinomycetales bacterium]
MSDTSKIHYNLLIDLSSTSPRTIEAIHTSLAPYIKCAVQDNSYLRVTIDPGSGRELIIPTNPELSGKQRVLVEFNNTTRQKQEEEKKEAALMAEIVAQLSDAELSETGSASRLLATAHTIETESSEGEANIYVLWSNLLGTSEDHQDCLDISGVAPTQENAEAMVARCIGQALIQPVTNAGSKIVGVGSGSQSNEQQRFATSLSKEISAQVLGAK